MAAQEPAGETGAAIASSVTSPSRTSSPKATVRRSVRILLAEEYASKLLSQVSRVGAHLGNNDQGRLFRTLEVARFFELQRSC
jgi:hypothetical protein